MSRNLLTRWFRKTSLQTAQSFLNRRFSTTVDATDRVVIAGGGVAGLSAALALNKVQNVGLNLSNVSIRV